MEETEQRFESFDDIADFATKNIAVEDIENFVRTESEKLQDSSKVPEKIISDMVKTIKKAKKNLNKKVREEKGKNNEVNHEEVGTEILAGNSIFSTQDNEEIYLYNNGVYRADGVRTKLKTLTRDTHDKLFWEKNPDAKNKDTVGIALINEVVEYIKAYTHIDRKSLDELQEKYIGLKNGLFDLKTFSLVQHNPKHKIIGQMNVTYNAEASCPKIEKYLKDCELSLEDIATLEEFAGYCMTTDTSFQKALLLYGTGANGKSVFINILKTILGPDYTSGETLQDLEIDKYRVANLYGKRLNAFPDLKDTPLQTNEKFNILTGNDGHMTGERKYQHAFDFKPTVKLLFSANKAPFAYSNNYAYYRRWIMIKFPHTFKKDEIDESLVSKLTTEEEKSGFLNLMIEGLKRLYLNRKFTKDADAETVEKEYLMNADNVTIFEEECLRDCSGNEKPTAKSDVYKAYEQWCAGKKTTPVTKKMFTKKMEKAGRRVHETTLWDENTKDRIWFSCFANTVVDGGTLLMMETIDNQQKTSEKRKAAA